MSPNMPFSIWNLLFICAYLLDIGQAAVVRKLIDPQQLVDKWVAELPGGAVAVALVSPSQTEYFFGGQLSPSDRTLPNDKTIFEIGSVTKGFTGLLLADQVLSGNVLLNDTLMKLLTDWPGRFSSEAGNLTLLELTTHSSGLPRMPDNMDEDPYVVYKKDKLYSWLDRVKLFQRGSFLYSNAGVGILGHALALSSGKSYEEFLKGRVLLPLGLLDATVTLNDEQKTRLAPAHGPGGEVVPNYPFDILAPAGALKFSVSELANFLHFSTGIRESSSEDMNKALEMATRLHGDTNITHNTIGLGWLRLLLPRGELEIWHDGATTGYNSYVGWVPERQIGVVGLVSIDLTSHHSVSTLAKDLLTLML